MKVRQLIRSSIQGGSALDIQYSTQGFLDGRLRWLRSVGSIIRDEAGKPSFFSGVSIETTRQVQDEYRKNQFISIVSHELKTPLTSLKGYIQILQQPAMLKDDMLSSTLLSKANSRLDKMMSLINGFLNVTLLETGKIRLNLQEFDIEVFILEIIEETNLQSNADHIYFTSCRAIMVRADQDKIGQVISNLLSNAIKYSSLDSAIHIQLEDKKVSISVEDEGLGIPLEEQERIFDRYYRVESSRNNHISGFGIGLYLCKEIIHEHKGDIFVQSELGKGSVVTFCLPVS